MSKSVSATVAALATDVRETGGRLWLVGGTVRDELLGQPPHNYDVEIFGLDGATIRQLVERYGIVKEVGRAFGILKLQNPEGEIDVASPRRERKVGRGHGGFAIDLDPHVDIKEASRRRDFTINAIMKDPLTGEMVDHWGGQNDLAHRVLRLVDERTFPEDPLRVLRAVQLLGRFELTVEAKTLSVLQRMAPTVNELPKDRRREEWTKLFLLSSMPSLGLAAARDIGLFTPYPEWMRLLDTPQEPAWHPEGDVWTHTLLVVDQAQAITRARGFDDRRRLGILLAGFCHDLGKAATTTTTAGILVSPYHDQAGVEPARRWLRDQGFTGETIALVTALVREHMQPLFLETAKGRQGVSDGAIRRLVRRLSPATVDDLVILSEADFRGRGPEFLKTRYPTQTWLLDRANQLALAQGPKPILQGRDLLALGWAAGPLLGEVIQAAEEYAERTSADQAAILDLLRQAGSPEKALVLLRPKK